MRTNPTVAGFADITVVAQELECRREVLTEDAQIKTVPADSTSAFLTVRLVLSLNVAVVVDMVNGKESWLIFATALTLSSIPSIHLVASLPYSLTELFVLACATFDGPGTGIPPRLDTSLNTTVAFMSCPTTFHINDLKV